MAYKQFFDSFFLTISQNLSSIFLSFCYFSLFVREAKEKKMSFDLGYDLTEALERRSHKITNKSIEALRAELSESKLVPKTITDKQIALFLDASDGSISEAKKTIEIYYDAKHSAPEHFTHRDPKCDEIEQCLLNQ